VLQKKGKDAPITGSASLREYFSYPVRNTGKKAPSGVRDRRLVEIGGNRQSCDPSITLLFKLVVEVVLGADSSLRGKDNTGHELPKPLESAD